MSGALAWQVKKTLIKSLFFVFEGEMVRGFARLSPSCVLRLFFLFFLSWCCPPQFSIQSNPLFIVSLFVSRMDDFTSIRTNRDINTPTICIHQASKRKDGISTSWLFSPRGTNKQFPSIYFGTNYCILSILIRGNYASVVVSVNYCKLLQIYKSLYF